MERSPHPPLGRRRPRPRSKPVPGPASLGLGALLLLLLLPSCGESEESNPGRNSGSTSGSDGAPPRTSAGGPVPGADPRTPDSEPGFPDEALARGLDYRNHSGEPSKATILEANGAGVAVLDLGNDGDLDVVFAQGLPSLGALLEGPGADLSVYENDGTGHFVRLPGPGLAGWWTGLATGDVNGDGRTDLVAGGFGQLALLLQDESGQLVPRGDAGLLPDDPGRRLVPGEARGAGSPPDWVSSLALADLDRDGILDLYVGLYLELDPAAPDLGSVGDGELAIPCRWKGHGVYCGPHGLVPQGDRVLKGLPDGRFADVTGAWLGSPEPGYTLGVAAFDADRDGDTDLYVANDSVANHLWINDGEGHLQDFGIQAGVAVSPDGAAEAGMGIAVGDVNFDGQLDLAVTNFSDEPTALYLSERVGFTNATYRYGLQRETRKLLSWGTHLEDFDGDGWLELFTANGHVYPQADEPDTGTRYGQADTLWHLGADRRARPVKPVHPRSILHAMSGTRGTAVADLDGDGRQDLLLARIDAPAALGMNRTGGEHHRLEVRLRGPARNLDAPTPRTPTDARGAQVIVAPPPDSEGGEVRALLREVQTAVGYQSASTPWLHFGLGDATTYDAIYVRWPSGRVLELPAGPSDRRLWIEEGRGLVREEKL